MSHHLRTISCCLFFLFFATASTIAQAPTGEEAFISQPDFAIKFAPLPLISTTPAFQFGVETKTFKLQGLQIELGYITSAVRRTNSDFDGLKIKSEYRFYKKQLSRFSNIEFVGIQHMYKTVNVAGEGTVWRFDRSYQQSLPIKVKNKINSVFLVGGFAERFANNFYIEIAVGVGARFLNVTTSELPEDAELTTNLTQGIFSPIRETGDYRFLDAFVSLKLAYYL